jgi:lysylphosphatidylglycerol synthetase-like protein (DUF2156 family)
LSVEAAPLEVRLAPGTRVVVLGNLDLHQHRPGPDAEELAKIVQALEPGDLLVLAGRILAPDDTGDAAAAFAVHGGVLDIIAASRARTVWITTLRDGADPLPVRIERFPELLLVGPAPNEDHVLVRPPQADPSRRRTLDALERLPGFRGAAWLDPSASITHFVVARSFARRMRMLALWVLVPILLLELARVPFILRTAALVRHLHHQASAHPAAVVGLLAIDALAVLLITALASRSVTHLIEEPMESVVSAIAANQAAHELFESLPARPSLVAVRAELAELTTEQGRFLACVGPSGAVLAPVPGRGILPTRYVPMHTTTWLELETGARVRAYLRRSRRPVHPAGLAWRLGWPERTLVESGVTLASAPSGASWPPAPKLAAETSLTVRRVGGFVVSLAGLVELLSAFLPPLAHHVSLVTTLFPTLPPIPRYADAISAATGALLLGVAQGLRAGQRRAWRIALVVLLAAIASNVLRRSDLVTTGILGTAVVALVVWHAAFRQVAPSVRRTSRALSVLGVGLLVALVAELVALADALVHRVPAHPLADLGGIIGTMLGLPVAAPPPFAVGELQDALSVVGVVLLVLVVWSFVAPVRDRIQAQLASLRSPQDPAEILAAHPQSTLDYFALRSDKQRLLRHGALVAYGEVGSVVIVSPDPIGPTASARLAFLELFEASTRAGKALCVLGASEPWAQWYREVGMRPFYLGDEAIVTLGALNLAGKRHKSLRQAVSRMRRYGYTVRVVPPLGLSPAEQREVLRVMAESRRGNRERGFSMTLGRVFDPRDRDLLMSLCFDPAGTIVGFVQWVPAPAINGYSLDLMRRDLGEHPNGMFDYLIVETMTDLAERGAGAISLNFAAMRGVLAGERGGELLGTRVERWVLDRLSSSMQIESLWRFNAKFEPRWEPRYLVVDAYEHLASIAIAAARVESLWDIPIVGRFLADPHG